MVRGILRYYHIDKLVTGNNHLIIHLGQGIVSDSHSMEV
jgi:hypothetical protein